MKRVNAITRCKGVLAEALDRKANRILRQVNQAIDAAKDKLSDVEEKTENLINSLGSVAGSDQTSSLQGKINEYIEACSEADGYKNTIQFLENLKAKLEEEVTLTEQEDGGTIIVKKEK